MSSSPTPQEQEVLSKLADKFGAISFEIIESVACAFNYNVDMSSRKLIEMTQSDSGQGNTTPPASSRRYKVNPKTQRIHFKHHPNDWHTANRTGKKQTINRDTSVPTELNAVNMQQRQRVREELKRIKNIDKVLKAIEHNYRVLILMRGLPGSGKTHLAHSILSLMGDDCDFTRHICSADTYFLTKDGTYNFVPHKLPVVHDKNQCKAFAAMRDGVSPVIIDNTNLDLPDLVSYANIAMDHGYYVEILEPNTYWKFDVAELAKRNKHNVPLETIKRMKERYVKSYTGYDLMRFYNLRYIRKEPPVLRNIPPIAPPTETVSCSNLSSYSCSGSQNQNQNDYSEMAAGMNSIDPGRCPTKSTDNINLMDFNEIDDSDSRTTNSAYDNDDVFIVDSSFPVTNLSKILQPHVVNNVPAPPVGQSQHQVHSIDVEAAWGVSERALHSWDVVTPLPETNGPRSGGNQVETVAETVPVAVSEVGCNTIVADFFLCRGNDVPDGYKVLLTNSRDINGKNGKTAQRDCVPKRMKLEKSCSVSPEDFEVKDKERDLQYLESVFNTTPKKYVKDMFENCGEKLEWAVELLLEDGNLESYNLAHSTDNEEEEEDVVLVTNKTSKKKRKSCEKNRKNGTKNQSPPGLLRFKYDDVISRSPVPEPARPGPSNEVIYVHSSDSDGAGDGAGAEAEGEKMVELDLGDHLVKQLSGLFKNNIPSYPKGFLPKVQVPLSLAEQLFGGYIESAYLQRDNQAEVLNELVKQDEEMARRIDDEQRSINEQTQSSSFLEESGVSESEFCKTATDIVVLRAVCNKLFTVFPHFDRNTMAEVLKANDYKYLDTLNTLLDSCPNDDVSRDPKIFDPPVSDEIVEQMRLDEQTFEEDCNVKLDAIDQLKDIRSQANKFFQDRAKFNENAGKFLKNGQGEVAEFYSNFSRYLTKLFERAHEFAVTRCLTANDIKNKHNENTLDLHGLYVKEAMEALDRFLDRHITALREGESVVLFIITGRGANSRDGIAKIKPQTIVRLRDRQLEFTQYNEGSLKVTVGYHNLTTSALKKARPDLQENFEK